MSNPDLELIPKETSKVYYLVKDFIRRRKLSTGDCRTFYTPLEWKYRKEECSQGALLVMVYDGSEVKRLVDEWDMGATFQKYLNKHGYYVEQGTHWYAGIYKI